MEKNTFKQKFYSKKYLKKRKLTTPVYSKNCTKYSKIKFHKNNAEKAICLEKKEIILY